MDKKTARQVLEEFTMRNVDLSEIVDTKFIDFSRDLFDKQREFIDSPAKKKAAICGRRAGKSVCCAYYLVKTAYEKKCSVAYIALSRKSAKDIIWYEITTILDRYKIEYETDLTALQIRLPNGSHINLHGAGSDREIDKHRGMHYELIIIDECGSLQFMPLLDNMLNNVLGPTLFDSGGTICMISSPGPICSGQFYRITEGQIPGWAVHHWTVLENPKFPRWRKHKNWRKEARELLGQLREENGWTDESPVYKREWLGKWIKEAVSLVYKFDADRNMFNQLPVDVEEWNYLIGVDFGIVDSSAIVVGAYSLNSPVLYIVDSFKNNGLSPGEVADIIKKFYEQYKPLSIVADSNGIGLAFISELENRYTIPIQKAEKMEKIAFIEMLNDDLKKGRIKIKDDLYELLEEITTLQWKDIERKILPDTMEDHLLDAQLYMWRDSLHYMGKKPKAKPKLGSREWADQMFDDTVAKLKSSEDNPWWSDE